MIRTYEQQSTATPPIAAQLQEVSVRLVLVPSGTCILEAEIEKILQTLIPGICQLK